MTAIATFAEAAARAQELAAVGRRQVLGLVGAPGSGKSTVASALAQAAGSAAVVVPMDGFHLAHGELERLGRVARKGAIDTFDGGGFVALVERLARGDEDVVYAPRFDRSLEEPVAGAIAVPREVPLVIVEGNYLLVDQAPWSSLRSVFAETWFLSVDDRLRIARLCARHEQFGRSPADARAHALGSDQRNAELIESTAARASVRLDISAWPLTGTSA